MRRSQREKNRAQAAKAPKPEEPPPAPEEPEEEIDPFEAAHDTMLRKAEVKASVSSQQTLRQLPAEFDDDDGRPKRPTPIFEGEAERQMSAETRQAIQATWVKANELQAQAVAAAVKKVTQQLREQAEAEKKAALEQLEMQLRAEAGVASNKMWEVAGREKAKAVEEALKEQGEALESAQAALVEQEAAFQAEQEASFDMLKEEVGAALTLCFHLRGHNLVTKVVRRARVMELVTVVSMFHRGRDSEIMLE